MKSATGGRPNFMGVIFSLCCKDDDTADDRYATLLAPESEEGCRGSLSSVVAHADENTKLMESTPVAVPITKSSSQEQPECVICFHPFSEKNPSTPTNCNCGQQQKYHLQCLMSWTERNETCPICSMKVSLCVDD